jgi:hypothetical protein
MSQASDLGEKKPGMGYSAGFFLGTRTTAAKRGKKDGQTIFDAFAKTQRMAKQKVRVVFQGRRHTSGMSRS